MAIQGHRVQTMVRPARGARDAVLGKSVRVALIGARPFSVSQAMRSVKTRQNRMTCNRRHNGKMPVVEEAPVPVAVRPARAVHVVAHVKVILAVAVAVVRVGRASRAVAIVRRGQTIRQAVLSQTQ